MKIKLAQMLPFLDEEDLSTLVEEIRNSDAGEYRGVRLCHLLPFLSEEQVSDLFLEELKEKKDVTAFYPFLPEKTYKEIVDRYLSGEQEIDINALYPFLPDKELHRLFAAAMQEEEA